MPHTLLHESFNTVYLHTLMVAIMESTHMHITRQRHVWMHIHIWGKKKQKTVPVLRIIRGLGFCVQQTQPIKCIVDPGKRWENRERSNLGVWLINMEEMFACSEGSGLLWFQKRLHLPPSIKQENWCVSLIMPVYHKSSPGAVINYFLPLQRTWQSRDE